jgi:hypothetical protein
MRIKLLGAAAALLVTVSQVALLLGTAYGLPYIHA